MAAISMYRLWSNTSCLKCLTYSRSSRSSSGLPGCRGWIFCHEGISGKARRREIEKNL
jgi:hypothetical protein